MFEAIVTLCLLAQPEVCRAVLVPGHEADSQAECGVPFVLYPPLGHSVEGTECRPTGPVAEVTEAAPGVFVHHGHIADAEPETYGDISNSGFIIGARSVAVIDSGGSARAGEELYRAIRARTQLPISHLILTHMHPDHIFGAPVFVDAGAEIVGHHALENALRDRQQTYLSNYIGRLDPADTLPASVAVPTITVEDSMEIDLGDRMISLRTWPLSHTGTDLTVLDETSGTLFTGDLIFHVHTPALDGSLGGWQSVLEELAAIPAARVVPGHGGPVLDWPAAAAPVRHYLDVLEGDARREVAAGASLAQAAERIGQGEAANWQLFDLFNPRNATVAFTELEWE
ncbi:quinoprotein relay system zinc metallohydrolase 2 [Algicella marina]|uniref:Quinoprotein relay system zinc metallohydrolase 2 n=1 Tax=Algicella marina TaxID=2683284 RepID=A0A6P1T0R7_9RHOB|nr:quinoprotein relay system zinc metallohydrolase 2 [Algicella marina]QHQ36504.1 quinoprotein relay system zinc metallohydrolase 2 [Algicella marina]